MSRKADTPLRAEQSDEVLAFGSERVEIAYDPDGRIWFVRASTVPGLRETADSRDELLDALPAAIGIARLP